MSKAWDEELRERKRYTEVVRVCMTPSQREQVAKEAKRQGLAVSVFLRQVIARGMKAS